MFVSRAALAEKELQLRKEATERAVADARYRELVSEQRPNLEKINEEIEEMTNIMSMNFSCARVSENQLRKSALSDHETLPHERSPQNERDASTTAIVENVVSIQRSRAPLAATSASLSATSAYADSPARFETQRFETHLRAEAARAEVERNLARGQIMALLRL